MRIEASPPFEKKGIPQCRAKRGLAGFPIHGCIDGWSRKLLWLVVTHSNNYNYNIASSYYLQAVEEHGGAQLSLILIQELKMEQWLPFRLFFRDDEHAHRCVSSPRNQRIEGYWSFHRRNSSTWWINFFQDLIHQNHLNTSSPLKSNHRIRQSKSDTIPGQLGAFYYLPEFQGGAVNLALPVPEREISYAQYDHLVENAVEDEYQQYFQYVIETNHVRKPVHWREALQLYHCLLQIAR